MKRLALLLPFCLLVSAASAQYALQFGSAVTVSGDDVIVGEGRNLLLPGSAYVFSPDGAGGYQLRAALGSGKESADGFGRSLAADDGTLVIGAPEASSVYVYKRDGDGWTHTAIVNTGASGFGSSVAYHDGHLLVGSGNGRGESGLVSAFHSNDGETWTPTGSFEADEPAAGDRFGTALSITDNHAAIGVPGANERQGMVMTLQFDSEAGEWKEYGRLHHPDPQSGDGFGSEVLAVFDYVAVGVPGRSSRSGSVVAFKRETGDDEWSLTNVLSAFDSRSGEGFGGSIAWGNGEVLVGAPGVGAREGALYRFRPDADTGRMAGTMFEQPTGLQFRSSFGGSIAANDRIMAVGAVGQDNFEGAAFVYTAGEEGWSEPQIVFHDSGRFDSITGAATECEGEAAGEFSCSEVDMMSFLSRYDIGAERGIQMNDVWGWEDPDTGREYALVGRTDGTSFIDLTDPYNPHYLGDLPKTATANQSLWRDIKVYKDHAFIVADGAGAHHVQIFDLTQLRDVTDAPVQFEETAIYKGVFSSHNIIINEETGFAFAVGSDSGGESCGGALHMIDVRDPVNPTFAGCFADRRTGRGGSGATHDAQCVTYNGPDADYQGREICLSSNGTALSIADVTEKGEPAAISVADYPNVAYAHQGWLTDDHRYFYLNDEGDEVSELVEATRTMIFDLTDLDDPVLAGEYFADNSAIDHNLYIKDDLMYQTNYQAGLRIIDISDPEKPVEVGYFDTVPYGPNDNSPVLGAWSSYPYFKSGVIVVTSGREGVFFLKKRSVDT